MPSFTLVASALTLTGALIDDGRSRSLTLTAGKLVISQPYNFNLVAGSLTLTGDTLQRGTELKLLGASLALSGSALIGRPTPFTLVAGSLSLSGHVMDNGRPAPFTLVPGTLTLDPFSINVDSLWIPLIEADFVDVNFYSSSAALPDLTNNRYIKLTAFVRDLANTKYLDYFTINNSATGLRTASVDATQVNVISNNALFYGADGGRTVRLGTDGFVYVLTADNTHDFSQTNKLLSKINPNTLLEVAAIPFPSYFFSNNSLVVAFKLGSTNYLAFAETGVGNPAHIAILNADTMTWIDSVVFPNGNADFQVFLKGANPDANSIELFIVHNGDNAVLTSVERIVWSTITGFSLSPTVTYPSFMWQADWDQFVPDITWGTYDPNDGKLIIFMAIFAGTYRSVLTKISPTSASISWTIPFTSSADDTFTVPSGDTDISNGRLLFLDPAQNGNYYLINTANGHYKQKLDVTHFIDYVPNTLWDGPNDRLTYLDYGDNDSLVGGTWNFGFAVYKPIWQAADTTPTVIPAPPTFTITRVWSSGTTITVPDIPYPNMAFTSATIHALGGGQAGGRGGSDHPGDPGEGSDYANVVIPGAAPGNTYEISIGRGGIADGEPGTDTWLKNASHVIILRARAGGSTSVSLGDVVKKGGPKETLQYSVDGTYGFIAIPGWGGVGGSSAAGPDNPGAKGGDTSWAVGQLAGTGGAYPNSLVDAPGHIYCNSGFSSLVGYGGSSGYFGTSGGFGHNNPPGNLDGTAGSGADGGTSSPASLPFYGDGGNAGFPNTWTDSLTEETGGPGGGGGGGGAAYGGSTGGGVSAYAGRGGRGGNGGGGGGGSGGWPSAGQPVRGNGQTFLGYWGESANPGAGGRGLVVGTFLFTALSPTIDIQAWSRSKSSGRAAFLVTPPPPPPPPPPVTFPFTPHVHVISQYANSQTLLRLLLNFDEYIDPTVNFNMFYYYIWNIDTAQGLGLDIWGRILGVQRTLQLNVSTAKSFGFNEAGFASADPFNVSPFYSGTGSTSNYNLADNDFRTLLFAKAFANICDGSIPAINQMLINLFGQPGGHPHVEDNGDMTLTYKFDYPLTPVQLAIIEQSNVLPKPAGVEASIDAPP